MVKGLVEVTQLINIQINSNQEQVVSGRLLHEFLEVKTPYDKWLPRMCEYGFFEGEDFSTFLSESKGGRPAIDHTLKLDMAKELCMLARSEKGKLARQYFIKIEKDWNSPDKTLARALLIADKKINEQALQIEMQKPKVLFADAVAGSKTSILVGDLAKIIKQNGVDIGQKRLFAWLREKGYLIKRIGAEYNSPTQRAMEQGLFEVKETSITHSDGHISISKTTKVTGKGQIYFINLFVKKIQREIAI